MCTLLVFLPILLDTWGRELLSLGVGAMIHLLPGQSLKAQIRSTYTSSSSLVRVRHQLVLQVNETAGEDCYFGSADRWKRSRPVVVVASPSPTAVTVIFQAVELYEFPSCTYEVTHNTRGGCWLVAPLPHACFPPERNRSSGETTRWGSTPALWRVSGVSV